MTRFRHVKAYVVSVCLVVVSPIVAGSGETGRELIESMSSAMQSLNYEGTFIYSHDGDVETMSIVHSNAKGVERERLLSLNGEAREIIRNDDSVVCIWPGTKSVSVSRSAPRAPFPEFDNDELARLEQHYEFRFRGKDRVAGRETLVVDIKPMDDFRYGYRLWIDAKTSMMLRSVMSDNQDRIIEQVMFTDVQYQESIPLERFQASLEGETQEWIEETAELNQSPSDTQPEDDGQIPGVNNMQAPAGFTVMSNKVMMLPGHATVRRIMYTDGLASLSVFIAPSGDDEDNVLHGESGMGAVHAYGVMQNDWHVTVVGEVPSATVKMLGDSLSLAAR